ncbi:MAG: hypothetical protein K0Q87_2695 [Neobacillus sp.]|jgi:diguanylate cyclase (GGDEF)-like protein|nr:hypothetical protein [Neobacillus sp.]
MITPYIQLFLFTFIIAILANYFRFKGNGRLNKWILLLSSLILVAIDGILFDFLHIKWLVLVFIGTAVICFRAYGGLVSTFIAWGIIIFLTNESDLFLLVSYLLFAMIVFLGESYVRKMKMESDRWLSNLIGNSKQLNVFKEISFSMQQTLDLQKILQRILTSVTAGHGLGFNRAMILLINEDGTKLNGIMGTGPMTAEEGYATWDNITKKRYKLVDLIEIKEMEKSTDPLLNEVVKRLEVSLDEDNFLCKTLESGHPLHIREMDQEDRALQLFIQQFNMNELVVFPLINLGIKVGVLIIDNPVNKRPITADGIDSVLPLANQAAIAIHHSRLYTKIEDMALKDGLTGLFNQRAFQTFLAEHLPKNSQDQLSLILLDIDFFKHFNDTNGHLLGNDVLIQLAEVIRNAIQEDHLAFRFGGEEFVILLPNTDKEMAATIAEKIRGNVEKTAFPSGENQPHGRLTISLGVASTAGFKLATAHNLVDEADKALYKAKEAGKNKVVTSED